MILWKFVIVIIHLKRSLAAPMLPETALAQDTIAFEEFLMGTGLFSHKPEYANLFLILEINLPFSRIIHSKHFWNQLIFQLPSMPTNLSHL